MGLFILYVRQEYGIIRFAMNNKITIIEGPTPEFQVVTGQSALEGSLNWVGSVMEGPFLCNTAFTNLRTLDSQKLLDRCLDTWAAKQTMYLEYRDRIGLRQEDPIVAARAISVEEGDMLLLWVRQDLADSEDETIEDIDEDDDIPF